MAHGLKLQILKPEFNNSSLKSEYFDVKCLKNLEKGGNWPEQFFIPFSKKTNRREYGSAVRYNTEPTPIASQQGLNS
jgi:hypothetical protein